MIRLGLCCIFRDEPIKFRTTTATAMKRLRRREQLVKLSTLCRENAEALGLALQYCSQHGIGCFRVNSQILPLKTHPDVGYTLRELPDAKQIEDLFLKCGEFAQTHSVRTTFHPDQFVVLNSPKPEVVKHSIAELEYQAEVAQWVAADVINIHAGGAYGDKRAALQQFSKNLERLSASVRQRLTVENDEKSYSPTDLLECCQATGVPLVYDVHHHRCHPDGLSVEEATSHAVTTWNREPLFHISSPLEGWDGPQPHRHHDYIDIQDFPQCWRKMHITVEVEAKAKELAVGQLLAALKMRR